MDVSSLPAVNASLNGLCTVLLLAGYAAIRKDRRDQHKAIMLAACAVSALFLTSYVVYHANAGSVPFPRDRYPTWAIVYYLILFPHILLAAINAPMVVITLVHALKGRFEKHRRIARWTYFIWLYVSVTGVLIYLMLYVWFPA